MRDRWGNRIYVGWARHEELWLEAAITLDVADRAQAYRDIAAMSGRSIDVVRRRARAMIEERGLGPIDSVPVRLAPPPPTFSFVPDKRRLMAGK